ncbi:MAG: hypothetical protein KGJ87_10630 [Planctomycetota bacterium]|nr:hypothetical protein [Planctomycetota bacterium]MDE2217597.1 hypothetical protein [Planctomycetota bacterium]
MWWLFHGIQGVGDGDNGDSDKSDSILDENAKGDIFISILLTAVILYFLKK